MDGASNAFSMDTIKTAIETVIKPFLDNLTVANVATVLGIAIGSCLALYLFYWGVRKAWNMLRSTFERGTFRV